MMHSHLEIGPLAFLYSGAPDIDVEQAKALGAIKFIPKPLEENLLVSTVVQALADAKRERLRLTGR